MNQNSIKNIIIEGADQSGKSILASNLAEELGWKLIHYGPPGKGFDFFNDYLPEEGVNTIFDRNYISELVYSKIDGHMHRIKRLKELEKVFKGLSTIVIVLYSTRKIQKREERFTRKQIKRARKLYGKVFHKITVEKYYLCLDKEEDLITIQEIIERCKH